MPPASGRHLPPSRQSVTGVGGATADPTDRGGGPPEADPADLGGAIPQTGEGPLMADPAN